MPLRWCLASGRSEDVELMMHMRSYHNQKVGVVRIPWIRDIMIETFTLAHNLGLTCTCYIKNTLKSYNSYLNFLKKGVTTHKP